jgi:hypothetical protein
MRLVIHLGATKTASTFLQKCLAKNEDVLREHGYFMPKAGRLPWATEVISHHNLAWEMSGDRRFRESRGRWSDMTAEARESGADTILLSSEAFARLASDIKLRSFLRRRMAELTDDSTLLYVVREPLARINSMYGQTIKTFGLIRTFEQYVDEAMSSGLYDLEKSFRYWYQNSPTAFVAVRFDELVENSPFPYFLKMLGLDIPAEQLTIPDDVINPSPGPLAIEAFKVLNARVRVMDQRFGRRSAATLKLSEVAQRRAWRLGWYDDPYWGWDPALAEKVAQRLKGSNQRFSTAVWGIDWPLPLPLDKPKAAIDLLTADPELHKEIELFVKNMLKRYRDVLKDRPRRAENRTFDDDDTADHRGDSESDVDEDDDVSSEREDDSRHDDADDH